MSEETRELMCRKGEVIVREGESGSTIYKILSGSAEVFASYGEAEQKQLTELHAGDYFGEMAVIEIARRSATVVAAEDGTRIAVVDAPDLIEFMDKNKGEINGIARHLSRRLRELTLDYTEVCDTLRELGRLDTSADRVSQGLMARIAKFARVYLLGQADAELEPAEPAAYAEPRRCGRELAVQSAVYGKGDVIFREASPSDCMYYIYDGRVGIYTGYGTDKPKLLTELTPDMFFGEMGLFEGGRRTATAVALEADTCVEQIGEEDLSVIFEKNPALAMMILQHLASRLRKLTTDYLKACKSLAETDKELENYKVTPEMLQRAAYMNQLMLAPELMF